MEGKHGCIRGCWEVSQRQDPCVHGALSLPCHQRVSACTGITHAFASVQSVICSCVPASTGIMLGRMGDSGAPLVNFCQCLNESVMKIVAVAVW